MLNNPTQPRLPNCRATPSANALVTPASNNAEPSLTSPPYQMNRSHAARSPFTSSQLKTPVISRNIPPPNAVTVTSILVHEYEIHRPHTAMKTTVRILSLLDSGPMAFSSRAAKAGASGVFVTLGLFRRITTHGTANKD